MFSDFQAVEVVRVIDGDGFIGKFSLGLPEIYREMSVRIKGIDAPELRASRECEKQDAYLAKSALTHFIGEATVDLYFCEKDKYMRLACSVIVNKKDAAEFMLDRKLAVPYGAGTKIRWECKK